MPRDDPPLKASTGAAQSIWKIDLIFCAATLFFSSAVHFVLRVHSSETGPLSFKVATTSSSLQLSVEDPLYCAFWACQLVWLLVLTVVGSQKYPPRLHDVCSIANRLSPFVVLLLEVVLLHPSASITTTPSLERFYSDVSSPGSLLIMAVWAWRCCSVCDGHKRQVLVTALENTLFAVGLGLIYVAHGLAPRPLACLLHLALVAVAPLAYSAFSSRRAWGSSMLAGMDASEVAGAMAAIAYPALFEATLPSLHAQVPLRALVLGARMPSESGLEASSKGVTTATAAADALAATDAAAAASAAKYAAALGPPEKPIVPPSDSFELALKLMTASAAKAGSGSSGSTSIAPRAGGPPYLPSGRHVRLSLKIPGDHGPGAVKRFSSSTPKWTSLLQSHLSGAGGGGTVVVGHGYVRLGCIQLIIDLRVPLRDFAAALPGGSGGAGPKALSWLLGERVTPVGLIHLLCDQELSDTSVATAQLKPVLFQVHVASSAMREDGECGDWAWDVDQRMRPSRASVDAATQRPISTRSSIDTLSAAQAPPPPPLLHIIPACAVLGAAWCGTVAVQVAGRKAGLQGFSLNARSRGEFLQAIITDVTDGEEAEENQANETGDDAADAVTTATVSLPSPQRAGLVMLEMEGEGGLLGACKPLLMLGDAAAAAEVVQLSEDLHDEPAEILNDLIYDLGHWIERVDDHNRKAQAAAEETAVAVAAAAARAVAAGTSRAAVASSSAQSARAPAPPPAIQVAGRLLAFFCSRGMGACATLVVQRLERLGGLHAVEDALAKVAPWEQGLSLLHQLVRTQQLAVVEAAARCGYAWAWGSAGPAGLTPLHLAAVAGGDAVRRLLALAPLAVWQGPSCANGLTAAQFATSAGWGSLLDSSNPPAAVASNATTGSGNQVVLAGQALAGGVTAVDVVAADSTPHDVSEDAADAAGLGLGFAAAVTSGDLRKVDTNPRTRDSSPERGAPSGEAAHLPSAAASSGSLISRRVDGLPGADGEPPAPAVQQAAAAAAAPAGRLHGLDLVVVTLPVVWLSKVAMDGARMAQAEGRLVLPEIVLPLLMCAIRFVPFSAAWLLPTAAWRRRRDVLIVGAEVALSVAWAACGMGLLPAPVMLVKVAAMPFMLGRVALAKPLILQVSRTPMLWAYIASLLSETALLSGLGSPSSPARGGVWVVLSALCCTLFCHAVAVQVSMRLNMWL